MEEVLIVDDNIVNASLVDAILCEEYKTKVILDPSKVMPYLENNKPDIILLDVVMPKISGFDLLKEIKAHKEFKKIKVLMISSLIHPESVRKAKKFGADFYIKKPVNMLFLKKLIKQKLIFLN